MKVEIIKWNIIKTNKNDRKKGQTPNIHVIYLGQHVCTMLIKYLAFFLYLNNDYYAYSNLNVSTFNQTTRQRAITSDTCIIIQYCVHEYTNCFNTCYTRDASSEYIAYNCTCSGKKIEHRVGCIRN